MAWTTTQIGAVAFDAVVLLATIIYAVATRTRIAQLKKSESNDRVVSPFFRMLGLYCTGYTVFEKEGETAVATHVSFDCCAGCFEDRSARFDAASDVRVETRPTTWIELNIHFWSGCLLGIFLHFLPCFSWSCDWGPGDNEGVRGGIWFGMWIVYAVVACVLPRWFNGSDIVVGDQKCRIGSYADAERLREMLEKTTAIA